MKLIQQRKLFFKEGNSDKVYEIDLCELTPATYLVNFRYGRRGSTLKEGTKTPAAVSRQQADKLFNELESEKRNKGYQTELETFIALPSLDTIEVTSSKGAILHRLQDAATGTKSFQTEWKTSRVIWKAGILHIAEAVPLIIRLANKGDEMQLYCALWALIELKATQADALFATTAANTRQKKHIRNIAWEGLLTLSGEEDRPKLSQELLMQLPYELSYAIESADDKLLKNNLGPIVKDGQAEVLTTLYLLSRLHAFILPVIVEHIGTLPFKPPYFKQIRAIYRLAQLRKDSPVIAILSYRFEKDGAMFKRTGPYMNERSRFIPQINQSVKVGAMLKSENTKLAYSNFTKQYFQKNSVEYIRTTGQQGDARIYLKLAIATLLQYTEADYTPAGERPLNSQGQYDYQKREYKFILVNYPECSESFLLSTILFGNDTRLQLQPSLRYFLGKRTVTSKKHYYSPNDVVSSVPTPSAGTGSRTTAPSSSAPDPGPKTGFVNTVIGGLKSLFGKKTANAATPPPAAQMAPPTPVNPAAPEAPAAPDKGPATPITSAAPAAPSTPVTPATPITPATPLEKVVPPRPERFRAELFPELWDSMPEAYVQLLMQARISVIHRFAFDNLKAHPQFEELINRFDQKALLQLLNSGFSVPGQLGFEVLQQKEAAFSSSPEFIGQVLNCNNKEARGWAQARVDSNTGLYFNDLDFVLHLLFNGQPELDQWVNSLLTGTPFSEERTQAILGKITSELLHLENSKSNNERARNVIIRLEKFAAEQMQRVSWNIVGQLISSPLEANKLLAGEILIKRSKHTTPTDIPVSLTTLFLKSELPEIRNKGMVFLEQYPKDFLLENLDFLLDQAESSFQDVVEAFIANTRKLLTEGPVTGNAAILHLVYTLMRKEKFEGAHLIINDFVVNELKPYWNTGLKPKDITKLIHSQYRISQQTGYAIVKAYDRPEEFSLAQIISFGSHELLVIRQWCWNYFTQNAALIRKEKSKTLNLLDSTWDDTRAFAFHFFTTEFTDADWDADTLIGIVDSIRPDVESFGKGLITRWFKEEHAMEYLTRLSEHPSVNVQAFISNYLTLYAKDKPELFPQLEFYFRSVLTRVNKGRVAKDHIFIFLHQEAIKNETAARWVASIIDDVAVQDTIQDKAVCIDILTDIKNRYAHMDMHLVIKN